MDAHCTHNTLNASIKFTISSTERAAGGGGIREKKCPWTIFNMSFCSCTLFALAAFIIISLLLCALFFCSFRLVRFVMLVSLSLLRFSPQLRCLIHMHMQQLFLLSLVLSDSISVYKYSFRWFYDCCHSASFLLPTLSTDFSSASHRIFSFSLPKKSTEFFVRLPLLCIYR